ncbi:MAG: hypothetical protein WA840_16685 [Caulobacteraceae bacterium]
MIIDTHFGLPLPIADALRGHAPASGKPQSQAQPPRQRSGRLGRIAFLGLALSAGLGMESYAATPSLQGRWVMTPQNSTFQESVMGPAPDKAVLTVRRDDRDAFSYELVESRNGTEVARGAYDISFAGAPSTSSVDGAVLKVSGSRQADGDVVIEAPPVGQVHAVIRVRQTGPDTAVLDHEVRTPDGATTLEEIGLIRADQTAEK